MQKNINISIFVILFLCGFVFCNSKISAYSIEKLNFSNEGDIVVGPGKTELSLDPGQDSTQEIIVSNRSGATKIIDISVEDFQGTDNPNETIQFLGTGKSPYSLKDYVKPETNQITLNFGERLRLPVVISVPKTAAPGGLYGAVMVSASNIDESNNSGQSGAASGKVKIITRVASLFFITVKGDTISDGSLKDFKTEKGFYESGPINFNITSQNNGSIYLSPYGTIEVRNILGQKIDERQVDPWFVMPASTREREIKWNSNFLFGRYTATLLMNRGYKDVVDSKSISFWVIPWKIISIILIGLILVIWFFVWVLSHLQWRKPQTPLVVPAAPKNLENKNQ